jgi:hypothetical protein
MLTRNFVIYVKRFLLHATLSSRDDKHTLLNTLWANISSDGSSPRLASKDISTVSQPGDN